MTNLMEILKEQAAFGFTGKINLLLNTNGQFQGVIYQHEGFIVDASYMGFSGKNALFKMIFEDVETSDFFKFIVEPELIYEQHFSIKMNFDEVKREAQALYQKFIIAKKLKPSLDLRLVINPEIITNDEEITLSEFDVLSTLAEWCKVADIYRFSKLMEFEVTNALVSLRKKRAIKVFQN